MNKVLKNCSILISSCDKFKDTWFPCVDTLIKYIGTKDIEICLITNELDDPGFPGICTIATGKDNGWSANLYKALTHLKTDYVILWLDDVFLKKKADLGLLESLVQFAHANSANYIRLRKTPSPEKLSKGLCTKIIDEGRDMVSAFPSLWKREYLLKFLRKHETAWEFEIVGGERARFQDGFYVANFNPFNYVHGVERGIWMNHAVRWLRGNGYLVDLNFRREMTRRENFDYSIRAAKGFVLNRVNSKTRSLILFLADRVYRLLGLK